MSSLRLFAALLGAAALPGCKGCRSERPYTPFGVASSLPAQSASAPPPASASSAAPVAFPVLEPALLAAAGARRWDVLGRTLEAPAGRVFSQAVGFASTDGAPAAVAAWTLPEPGNDAAVASPGELWLYAADGSSRTLFAFPAFLPTGPGASAESKLAKSGNELVLALSVVSSTPLIARSPTRAVAVVDPAGARTPAFGLRATDSAPGETLEIELAPHDDDGDGRDDFRVLARLRAGAAPPITVPLVWFDRAAGASRDLRQPRDELSRLLRNALVQAKREKQAAGALRTVEMARRLLGSVCAEGGTPRVFDWDGSPIPCGNLSALVELAADVEITAALTQGDGLGALGALGRDGWYFGKLGDKARAALVTRIEKKLSVTPAASRRLDIAIDAAPPTPRYSPLAFEPDGALLVESRGVVRRFAPDGTSTLVEPDAGPPPWPLEVTLADGSRWAGATYSCDRSEVVLEFVGGATPSQPTALLSPRPGVCRGAAFAAGFAPVPLASSGGLEALVGGALVPPAGLPPQLAGPVPRGSARSSDRSTLVVPTVLGLWVAGPRPALWKIDGFSTAELSGCVVANGGSRAACLRGATVELYAPL